MNEYEAHKKLFKTLVAIVVILFAMFIGLKFFAPNIGSIFGVIARFSNRNVKDDVNAPAPPQFVSAPEAVKDKTIRLTGFSEPGTTIKLFLNGPEKAQAVTDSKGAFDFTDVELLPGRNTIFAKAVDIEGNESNRSEDVTITLDTQKPKIEILEPKKDSQVKNLDLRVLVKGKTDEKCEVYVNEKIAQVHPDNTFELLLGVVEGEVTIKVEAKDTAGNSSTESLKVTYVRQGF
jgi:hypothetical protein